MSLINQIKEKAKKLAKTIVLPESEDERVLFAAQEVKETGIAKPILIGKADVIKADANKLGVDLKGIDIVDPAQFEKLDSYVAELVKLREKKGMTAEKAKEIMLSEPRYFGAMMVRLGDADGMVAGSSSPTADVLRASIQVIGTKAGLKTVSSCFLMILPEGSEAAKTYGKDGALIYSDCGVVPNPTSEQLADIAISAAESGRALADMDPKVALLSFSTKGSAKHDDVDKVTATVEILKERNVDFEFDGELQGDAALVQSIGSKKAPGSKVAGQANILVFPDLDAGNIAYKLTQRLAGADAYGPLLQGLAKPVNDLSRGCSAKDIVDVVAITAAQVTE
jgi:phosphate acetyltransferase